MVCLRCRKLLLEELLLVIVDIVLCPLDHLLFDDLGHLKRHSIDTLCLALDVPFLLSLVVGRTQNAIPWHVEVLWAMLLVLLVELVDKVPHNLLFMLIGRRLHSPLVLILSYLIISCSLQAVQDHRVSLHL